MKPVLALDNSNCLMVLAVLFLEKDRSQWLKLNAVIAEELERCYKWTSFCGCPRALYSVFSFLSPLHISIFLPLCSSKFNKTIQLCVSLYI
jgi:hypothetical protein